MVVDGVLIPQELRRQSRVALEEYAQTVKQGNRTFLDRYFALEDQAHELGFDLEELDR